MKPARNDPCNCGSGKKYKHCCERKVTPLSQVPSPAELNQLIALFNAGRYAELECTALFLIKQYPNSGFAWMGLGLSLQMQGKDALHALRKTTELLPNDANAHNNLANTLRERGQFGESVASCRRALKLKPDFAEAHSNLGLALLELGQPDVALPSFRRALEIKPDFAEAHSNLGYALQELRKFDDALTCCRRALEIKPDFADAYNNLGNALKELGQLNDAVASYRRALEIKPDFAKAHSNLGFIMRELGQPDDELECYRLALASDPQCSEAILGMGQLCMAGGKILEAEGLFRKALEVNPDNLEARLLLAQVNKVKVDDENFVALAAIKNAMRRSKTPLPYQKAIFLQFALGKCFDDIGEYDRAFPHFAEGCKLKRATFDYDASKTTQHFNDIMRIFSREMIERLRGGGDSSRVPIFVVGMARSGTTLSEQIIASHPDVHGAGELPDLMDIAQRDVAGTRATFPNNIPALDQNGLAAWGADYAAGLVRRAPGASHITDKMPANFLALGLIHVMLPNAKIIHVNRNPVDTCLSCFMQLFSYKQEQTYDLAELGRYYADYARLMEHWRSVLPAGAFLDVQYEDIIADQETQARRMIAACGLDWNDACIDFHKNKRLIHTASVTQVRQPIYKSSVERWRNYEKFLDPLLGALGNIVPKRW